MSNRVKFSTLVEALEINRDSGKSVTYIEATNSDTTLTYQQLHRRALGLLGALQRKGISEGDELIIFTKNNERFVEMFWACLLGGVVPVPVAVGISDEHRAKLFRIFNKLKKPYLYTDQENMERLKAYAESNNTPVAVGSVTLNTLIADTIGDTSNPGTTVEITPDTRAFIQFSSGSTSEPKGVILSHRNLMATIGAIGERGRYSADDVSLSWMPLTHDLGLIGFHLSMVVYNMNQYLMSTDLFSRRPLVWLKKAAEHKVSLLTSPNFGFKHFLKTYTPEKLGNLDLSSIRLIYNGAEPISIDLCHQFLDTMEAHHLRRSAMYTVYGLAEACLAVSLPEPGKEFEYVSVDRHAVNVGQQVTFLPHEHPDALNFAIEGPVVVDCDVKITDFDNNMLENNHVGEVQIKGANVTAGYYNDDAANATAFTGGGWLNTGDLGFFCQEQLVITGRTKDIVFVNGQNYYPHDIEAIALRCGQLELGKVVVCGLTQDIAEESELLVFILFRGALSDFIITATDVKKHINERMCLEVTHVIPVKQIPKTTSGKIQRHYLAEQYLQGEYQQVLTELAEIEAKSLCSGEINEIAMSDRLTGLETQFQTIGHQAITGKKLELHDNLFDVGISSLELSEIHQQIDDLYPDLIDITDIFDYPSLAKLAGFLKDKIENNNDSAS
ncbi:MAG: AMP-binding protein [Gammaproteobacteria bacterium]|nr:AMP-binding protein [Gammaproteobacteria bacterium]